MRKSYLLLVLSVFLAVLLIPSSQAFEFSGYTYNTTRDPVNGTNVTIEAYSFGGGPPVLEDVWSVLSNGSGFFNVTGIIDDPSWFYKPIVYHYTDGDVDYVGPSLPQFPLMEMQNLGPINFLLKRGATINITAQGDPWPYENISVKQENNMSTSDYWFGLEYLNESDRWAYINTTGSLVILNASFGYNSSHWIMPAITAMEYVGNGIFYFVNGTPDADSVARVNVTDSGPTVLNTYNISGFGYQYVGGIEYNGTDFYLSVVNSSGPSNGEIEALNSTFDGKVLDTDVPMPVGDLEYLNNLLYIANNNSQEFLEVDPIIMSPKAVWEVQNLIEGIEHNGVDWHYSSSLGRVVLFDLYTTEKSFQLMVKDTKLGYPVAEYFAQDPNDFLVEAGVYLPADRNYSVMIYPDMAFPVSYDLNNLSAYSDPIHVDIEFNTSEEWIWVSGYADYGGSADFDELTVIAFLLEPGRMVFKGFPLPYNMSAWRGNGESDQYNLSTGFYNISLPASAMGSNLLLFANAKNNSNYYGNFRNITLTMGTGDKDNFNFTLQGLVGQASNITMEVAVPQGMGNRTNITTSEAWFKLTNETGASPPDLAINAHIEVEVDYTDVGGAAFSWMADVSQEALGRFKLPLLSHDIKQMDIYTPNFAPQKTSLKASDFQEYPLHIVLNTFDPGAIEGPEFTDIFLDMLISNTTCDVPYPPQGCSLVPQEVNESDFNPLSVVMGGGDISFRMKKVSNNITVHYELVDLLASGPPDVLFDGQSNATANISVLEEAWRFGSKGPEIYAEILVGFPYNGTALDEARDINVSIEKLYDEDWNVTWDQSVNGSTGYPANNTNHNLTDYADFDNAWFDGMICNKSDPTLSSSLCYADTQLNMVWIRIPHFSGVGPKIQGDSNIPNVTLVWPDDGYNTSDSTPTFTFNVNDSSVAVLSCVLYINGTQRGSNASTLNATDTNITSSALAPGSYSWYINCSNGAYTGQSETRTLGVDTLAPSVVINTPVPTGYQADFAINATVIDTGVGIDTVQYRWQNATSGYGTWTDLPQFGSTDYYRVVFSRTSIPPGTYTFHVRANDTINNTNTTSVSGVEIRYACGDNVTQNATLTYDITGCSGNGLVIKTGDVALDCRGHAISGSGSNSGISSDNYSSTTIRNCTISGFQQGIYLKDSVGSNVTGNTVYDNGNGMNLNNVNSSYVTDNNVSYNTNNDGIYMISSHGNTISGNRADFNRYGVYMRVGSSGNTIYMNTLKNNTDGIYITDSSATIEDNTIKRSSDYGLAFDTSSVTLTGNTICYNNASYKEAGTNSLTIENNSYCIIPKSPVDGYNISSTEINFTVYVSNKMNASFGACYLYLDSNPANTTSLDQFTDNSDNTLSNISVSVGSHTWYLECNDTNNNRGRTPAFIITTTVPADSGTVIANTTAGGTATINKTQTGVNVGLDIFAEETESANITINEYSSAPAGGSALTVTKLGRYVAVTSELKSMSWAIIRVYYSDSEVSAKNLNESSLRLWYYNASSGTWTEYDTPNGGVNTTGNYVWANTTHVSLWGNRREYPAFSTAGQW